MECGVRYFLSTCFLDRIIIQHFTLHIPHPFQHPHQLLKVNIPIGEKDAVVGTVVLAGEPQSISRGVLAEPFGVTKDVMTKGMTFKEDVLEVIVDQLGRRVVITLDFIADYLYLLIDFLLGVDAMEHDIGQHIYSSR